MKRIAPVLVIFGSIWLSACNFSLAADVTPPPGYQQQPVVPVQAEATMTPVYPLVPPDPAAGKAIYLDKCEPCHGPSGLGDGSLAMNLPNPAPPIGTGELARLSPPARWFDIVTNGNMERNMPPFKSLTDRQRWDVVAYLYSLSNAAQVVDQGAALYDENCAQCHGTGGKGDGAQAGELSVPDFTRLEVVSGKSQADFYHAINDGISPDMPAFSGKLDADAIWALTAYIRSLGFEQASADVSLAQSAPSSTQGAAKPLGLEGKQDQIEEPNLGAVSGLVVNGTGSQVPVGAEVMLHVFDQMQLVYTATTQVGDDGMYAFSGVNVEPGLSFLSTIDHGGVVYGSELVKADPQNVQIDLPIQLFDTTSDTSSLSIDRLHYFFEFLDEKTVRVVELYVISNLTDRTVAAPKAGGPVVSFSLPPGASNLEFQDGELGKRYQKTEDGFADTMPVRPGSGIYQVLYSYEMPYDRKLELKRRMPLNTNAIVILVPEDSVKVKSDQIQDTGVRDVQGVQYHMYSGGGLARNAELSLTVSGGLRPGAALSVGSNTDLIVGTGALGIVMILLGVWMYRRNKQDNSGAATQAPSSTVAMEKPEVVMDAILALDDLYQAGQLPEEAYLQRRGELKSRLKELLDQQG